MFHITFPGWRPPEPQAREVLRSDRRERRRQPIVRRRDSRVRGTRQAKAGQTAVVRPMLALRGAFAPGQPCLRRSPRKLPGSLVANLAQRVFAGSLFTLKPGRIRLGKLLEHSASGRFVHLALFCNAGKGLVCNHTEPIRGVH